MSNCAVITCINTGISTRGPNFSASFDNASSWPNSTRGSLPLRPRLLTISKLFFWMRLGVRSSSLRVPFCLASSSAWARSLAASSLALRRSSERPCLSLTSFSLVTTVRLSQRARPLSSPAPPASESLSEDEELESLFQLEESSDPSESESESLSLSLSAAFFFFFFFPESLELLLEPLPLELLLLPLEPSSSFSSSLSLLELELLLESLSLSLITGFFRYSSIIPRYGSLNFFKLSFILLSARPCAGLSFLKDALSARHRPT
mmetsp:Transcript_20933/g.44166  ORF Transcript_20933/g.44166 Transcript_20933/m.44166 type:complete len:263 (+) Transcript_20933:2037-2825(+)